jgi:hypothetical protein
MSASVRSLGGADQQAWVQLRVLGAQVEAAEQVVAASASQHLAGRRGRRSACSWKVRAVEQPLDAGDLAGIPASARVGMAGAATRSRPSAPSRPCGWSRR